jgi:hypothetical protein
MWIDLIFGVATRGKLAAQRHNTFNPRLYSAAGRSADQIDEDGRRSGQLPIQLFTRPHLPRQIRPRAPTSTNWTVLNTGKTLAFAAILEIVGKSASVGVVTTADEIYEVADFVHSQLPMRGKLPSSEKVFGRFKHGFAAVERKSCLAHFYSNMNVTAKPLNFANVEFIATSGSWVVISSRDGQVIGWNMKELVVRQVVSMASGYISCLALGWPFGIVVAGTEDSKVIVSMMGDGSFLWSAGVNTVPERVVVTEGWGFVFVQTVTGLYLFNVNGRLLRERKTDMDVDFIATWKCERGFDYVAMADRKGRVQLFEAFYMDVEGAYIEVGARILAMGYNLVARSLIAVTENGEMLSIPQPLPQANA